MQKTIGQQLSAARKHKKLSLEAVSEKLYIRQEYLLLMEKDLFEDFPSTAQARGFLKLYSDFLRLDSRMLLDRLVPVRLAQAQTEAVLPEPPDAAAADRKLKPRLLARIKHVWNVSLERVQQFFSKKSVQRGKSPKIQIEEEKPASHENAQQVFKDIGSEISRNRESLGLSLEDLERATTIKKKHLEWIESGNFENFSSPIQARGLLQNYVQYMSMDLDEIMLRYANALLSLREKSPAASPGKSRAPRKQGRFFTVLQFITPNLLIGVFLLATVVCLLAWGINRMSLAAIAQVTVSAPPISEVLMSTQDTPQTVISIGEATEIALTEVNMFVTPDLIEATNADNTPATPTETSRMQMNVSINQRAYLLVIADGVEKINGRVKAGDTYQFTANQSIEIATGNAAAISLVYGQNNLGVMGNPGEAFHLVFTLNGVFTPTPKATATPTLTKPATKTPTPTRTMPAPTITPYIP